MSQSRELAPRVIAVTLAVRSEKIAEAVTPELPALVMPAVPASNAKNFASTATLAARRSSSPNLETAAPRSASSQLIANDAERRNFLRLERCRSKVQSL